MHKQSLHTIALVLPTLFFAVSSVHSHVINIKNDQDFKQPVLKDSPAALVQFSASWCNVCNGVKQPLEEIALEKEFANVTFARVDIDDLRDLSKKHNIMGVPTFVYVENGSTKNQIVGISDMKSFKDDLRKNLRQTFKIAQAPQANSQEFEMPAADPEISSESTEEATHACSMHNDQAAEEKHMAGACAMADEDKMEGACGMKDHDDHMHGACAHGGFLAQLLTMIKTLGQKAVDLLMWVPRKLMEMIGS